MDLVEVLRGVLPPAAIALLLVGVGGARVTSLAVAVAVHVAHGVLKAWPAWPHELVRAPVGSQWLVWVVAAAAVVAVLEHVRVLAPAAALALGAATGAGGVWLVLQKVVARQDAPTAAANVGGGALVAVLSVLAARGVLARAPAGVAPAIVWSLVLGVDAVLLALGGFGFAGQLCGAAAAAVGAAASTAAWRRPFALRAADGTWLALVHVLLLLAGVHLGSLPWSAAAFALVAPVLLLLAPVGGGGQGRWLASALGLVLVPLAAAGWLA